jgi:hypothetical protein
MNKFIYTYHYKKLTERQRAYKPIRMKFWLWGFGATYESKTTLKGFAINSRAYETAKDLTVNKRIEKK